MTALYLVRHAQAMGNAEGRFQGRTDSSLTGLGRQQAAALARRFHDVRLDAVYASPLVRALQTAEAVAAGQGLAPVPEPELIEIDGGGMEDKTFAELLESYPGVFLTFDTEPYLFEGIGGGESMRSVYERMIRAIDAIFARHTGQTVLAVSHGCAIRAYLCHALGYPPERMGEVGWGHNTGVTLITEEDGARAVRFTNDFTHLDDLPEAAQKNPGELE